MTAYLINIFLLLVFGVTFLGFYPSQKCKKVFCIIASLQWIILSGLRHLSIGEDTLTYKINFFEVTKNESWENIFRNFVNIVFKGTAGKDPGYQVFEKLTQVFTSDYQVYLLIIASLFTITLSIWIYKNSTEPLISFLIYSCLFYSFYAITGHRQTIATALTVFIGYKYIKKREFWRFLIIVLVSSTIHKSSICFLPFYFIANKKITTRYIVITVSIIPLLFIFKNQIMVILGTLTGYKNYINQYEGAGTWTFTSLLFIITFIVIWKREIMLRDSPQANHFINALFMALIFVPLTFVDPSAMRVVQYYSLFLMLLVPDIIKSFDKNDQPIVYYTAITLLIVLFAKNNPQYLFFWQV
jgi:transmembrane protein EpsG